MSTQIDMYSTGVAHSVAPYLDPAKVAAVSARPMRDLDCPDGDRIVFAVEVIGHDGAILFADVCENERAATRLCNKLSGKQEGNRQQLMFL